MVGGAITVTILAAVGEPIRAEPSLIQHEANRLLRIELANRVPHLLVRRAPSFHHQDDLPWLRRHQCRLRSREQRRRVEQHQPAGIGSRPSAP